MSRKSAVHPRARAFKLGLCLYLGLAATLVILAFKPEVSTRLSSGDTIHAEFPDRYKLRQNDSSVKMAGITVGNVIDVEPTDEGTTLVTMKLEEGVLDKLGSAPSARIEPRTILGGRYAVELDQGGEPGQFTDDTIPLERTTAPVELDAVLEALPESARENVQHVVPELGDTLKQSKDELAATSRDLPPVLTDATPLVGALRGRNPDRDLSLLVSNLSQTARVLRANDDRLDNTAGALDRTVGVLAANRRPLAAAVATLPETLRSARAGMSGLTTTVEQLEETAESLEPTAPELADLITKLTPTLREAQPVLRDLRPMLRDARPAVRALVPTSRRATTVLDDLEGPVLDRVNGPVLDFVLNPWHGSGPYSESGYGMQEDHKVYEELAYMATNIDRASMTQDSHGSTLGFQVGFNEQSIAGLPFTFDNLLKLAIASQGGQR